MEVMEASKVKLSGVADSSKLNSKPEGEKRRTNPTYTTNAQQAQKAAVPLDVRAKVRMKGDDN